MEITCNRCHQTVQADNCYCPACGLPQLVYTADGPPGQSQPERWDGAARDAASVDWKSALRAALLVAIPAGAFSSGISPLGALGMVWMSTAAMLAVVLYMRSQKPAWITLGAGARIGLVTGLFGTWLGFGLSGGALFVQRFLLHQSSQIDAEWKTFLDLFQDKAQQSTAGMGPADAAQVQAAWAVILTSWRSPEGHAGMEALGLAAYALFLLFFAVVGGALGARMLARTRRSEV